MPSALSELKAALRSLSGGSNAKPHRSGGHVPSPLRALALAFAASALCVLASTPARSQGQDAPFFAETAARSAYVIDVETGSVLLEKNGDQPFAPASLAKLMTADIVFDALAKGAITRDQAYPVSDRAWRTGGAPSRTAAMIRPMPDSGR